MHQRRKKNIAIKENANYFYKFLKEGFKYVLCLKILTSF